MAKLKKTTPRNFDELLARGDVEAIKTALQVCEPDARGGVFKQPLLAFNDLPDSVAVWLIQRGADLQAIDGYGLTPLLSRAGHFQGRLEVLLDHGADPNQRDNKGETALHKAAKVGHAENVRLLLRRGADPQIRNHAGMTPLLKALAESSNASLDALAAVAEVLVPLLNGAVPDEAKGHVTRIGERFEFYRADFNPETVEEASAALDRLYELFGVPPVPRKQVYDGRSPIFAKADNWADAHEELWALLVPGTGAASTVQGEVIRLSGKIARELDGNGGINWDADFRKMADALPQYFAAGTPLPHDKMALARDVLAEVKRKGGDTSILFRLAVDWVALNPMPIPLGEVGYRR